MTQTDHFGRHEVLHTASVVMNLFDREIMEHEAVALDPKVKLAAEAAASALFDFYQACGAAWLADNPEPA